MSRQLARLLNLPENTVDKAIGELEKLAGYPSHDARLLAELQNNLRRKTADLGLDADDTTPTELYHALLSRLASDNERLSKVLGGLPNSFESFAKRLVTLLEHVPMNRSVWVIKKTAAKELLRQQPPKHLMKILNCRSMESLLKRQNVAVLYAALPAVESQRYLKSFWRAHAKLTPADFEERELEIVVMPEKLGTSRKLITTVPQLGAIALWPSGNLWQRAGFCLGLDVLANIEKLKIYSAWLKLEQSSASFGKLLTSTNKSIIPSPASVADLPINWSGLHRHFGRPTADGLTEMFSPYLQKLDLHNFRPIEAMSATSPVFHWWSGTSYTGGLGDDGVVSLNVQDVLHNRVHQLSYNKRSTHHLQKSLWDELMCRYLPHDGVEAHVLGQLSARYLQTETIGADTDYKNYLPDIKEMAAIT